MEVEGVVVAEDEDGNGKGSKGVEGRGATAGAERRAERELS